MTHLRKMPLERPRHYLRAILLKAAPVQVTWLRKTNADASFLLAVVSIKVRDARKARKAREASKGSFSK